MEGINELSAMVELEAAEAGAGGLSEVERLTNEFEAHEGHEEKFLLQYKELIKQTGNPLIKFLLQLIVSDEEKHHAVSHAMLSTLKGDLNWTKPADALRGLYNLGAEKEPLMELTEGFIRVERNGIKEYKKLIKESKGYYHDLFVLLFQSMVHDSEKHIKILEFLRQRLKEA
jgi:bacterioferritin (cytochrome b1)